MHSTHKTQTKERARPRPRPGPPTIHGRALTEGMDGLVLVPGLVLVLVPILVSVLVDVVIFRVAMLSVFRGQPDLHQHAQTCNVADIQARLHQRRCCRVDLFFPLLDCIWSEFSFMSVFIKQVLSCQELTIGLDIPVEAVREGVSWQSISISIPGNS